MNTNTSAPAPWTPATADEIRAIRTEVGGDAGDRRIRIILPSPWRRAEDIGAPASECAVTVRNFLTLDQAQRETPRAVAAVVFYLLSGSTDAVLTAHNTYRGGLASQLRSLRRDTGGRFGACEDCGTVAHLDGHGECAECAARNAELRREGGAS